MTSWRQGNDAMISTKDISNKTLSRKSNYIADVVM